MPPSEPQTASTESAPSAPPPITRATPVMAQYLKIKQDHPAELLFFRMGDFFELFFEDAVTAARALDIALTRRGKHKGQDIPMCGVPAHSAEGYIARLIRQGQRVAICEQVEDPAEARKRGSKAVVRRDVVRVVTQGTLTEESLLDARAHNYLAALAEAQRGVALAWLDISTGDFQTQALGGNGIAAALARLEPGELLVSERFLQNPDYFELFGEWRSVLTPLPSSRFDSGNAQDLLQNRFGVKALDAFGDFNRAELAAAGALLDYVSLTQKGAMPRLSPPRQVARSAVMEIDAATRRNLELSRTLSGDRKGSLLAVIDRTVTGPGARLLSRRIAAPLTDPAAIAARLDKISFFVAEERLRSDLRDVLRGTPDMERALSRLTVGRGGPRDLLAIRAGLDAAKALADLLSPAENVPDGVHAQIQCLGGFETVAARLARALTPEPPLFARDGGFIAEGYSEELDENRVLRDQSRRLIADLEHRYREDMEVPSLKIRHNNVLGYFIEVTNKHSAKFLGPDGVVNETFIHRQTMANAARFTTVALSELESKLSRAAERTLAIELALFDDLVTEVTARGDLIARAARAVAVLDVASALAKLAVDQRYIRPQVTDGLEFEISGGRHPVVEAALQENREAGFVPNDCDLGPSRRLWLVTGPNMAGKSTFLRQNALIAVLAQIGSYVPAERARIGAVDRLFSRVGAADDLARGRSTFMVEMVETAAILNQAGRRALVILDEIGRGTATYDGLSIAWASVEHLHDVNNCRALFATHYHELTALSAKLDKLVCHTMRVKEWEGDVVFLHEVVPGTADRSYGIHVAELAGLPPRAIARAQQVLETLEQDERSGELARLADDLPLFGAAKDHVSVSAPISAVEEILADVRPDELTPRDALELVYKLRGMLAPMSKPPLT